MTTETTLSSQLAELTKTIQDFIASPKYQYIFMCFLDNESTLLDNPHKLPVQWLHMNPCTNLDAGYKEAFEGAKNIEDALNPVTMVLVCKDLEYEISLPIEGCSIWVRDSLINQLPSTTLYNYALYLRQYKPQHKGWRKFISRWYKEQLEQELNSSL